jgi:hypothetical protein
MQNGKIFTASVLDQVSILVGCGQTAGNHTRALLRAARQRLTAAVRSHRANIQLDAFTRHVLAAVRELVAAERHLVSDSAATEVEP